MREVGLDPDQHAPVLLHLLGIKDVAGAAALASPEAVKGKAFEVLRRLSIRGSRQRPLILVLEDLHWVDNVSEEFLGILAEDLSGAPIFLLAAYRPGYRPPWLDKSYAGQIPLNPLTRNDSLRMVRSLVRAERIVDRVADEIVAKADGNPLFLEQLALHAGETGGRRSVLMVPNTIHDVVMARTDRLSEAAKQLLQTAAVIGRDVPFRLLRAVIGRDGALAGPLRELSRLEFLYERVEPEGAVHVFRHALTQEAVYGSLLERHRRSCHSAVGHALEELYEGRTDEVAELLAFHFGRSDEAEKAVDCTILAAEKSQRRWANTEALGYFSDALRRLDAMPDTEPNRLRRIDAVLKQAEVKYALGQYTDQVTALKEIRTMIDEIGDPRHRATWYYWSGFLHGVSGGQPEFAIEYCREAAKIATAAGLEEIDAFAQSSLSQVYMVAGRLREAVDAGERALANFESRGNLWWAALTLWNLTAIANYLGDWDASLQYCRRALDHGVALDDLRLKAVSWSRMGAAHIGRGEIERGIRCCDEALALEPMPRDASWARLVRGYGKIKGGQVEDGIAELKEALVWFARSRMRWTEVISTFWLAEGYLRGGDRASARSLIEDVLEASRRVGYLHFEGRARWLMSECLAAESLTSAEDYAETAMRIFESVGARNDLAKAMLTRAALRQRAGDVSTARELLDQAEAIFISLGTRDEPVRVKRALGALERGLPIHLLANGP